MTTKRRVEAFERKNVVAVENDGPAVTPSSVPKPVPTPLGVQA